MGKLREKKSRASERDAAQAAAARAVWLDRLAFEIALESGDPRRWPEIELRYRDDPSVRWETLLHIRCYWTGHGDLVAPLIRAGLRDLEWLEEAVQTAAAFPALTDEVVEVLRVPGTRQCIVIEEAVLALARLFGHAATLERKRA